MTLIYRNVTDALRGLSAHVMKGGAEVPSRNGTTKELLHAHVVLTNPLEREIRLPGRGHNPVAQIAETVWVLAGRNDVDWLAHYLPRAPDFSDDGKTWRAGYGPRLRAFGAAGANDSVNSTRGADQLKFVVDLLTADPGSRRAVISLWDPAVDTQPGKDIPCNDWLHFIGRNGVLDLHVAVRSNDLIWGWSGINAYEWSVLLEVVAQLTGMKVGELHFSISSLHVYDRHWGKARKLAEAELPAGNTVQPAFTAVSLRGLDSMLVGWFRIEEDVRNGFNRNTDIAAFPDPLLRYWLIRVRDYWNEKRKPAPDPFADKVTALHDEKHKAYGNSWMKRGELFSIIPNIARKVDRIGTGIDTSDETQADTAADLLVYLAKYRVWLTVQDAPVPVGVPDGLVVSKLLETTEAANGVIRAVKPAAQARSGMTRAINTLFEDLLKEVERGDADRWQTVDMLLQLASGLARSYV